MGKMFEHYKILFVNHLWIFLYFLAIFDTSALHYAIFTTCWKTSKITDCWYNLQVVEEYLKSVHVISDYKHIEKLCLIGIMFDSMLIIANILWSLWELQMIFEYFIYCLFSTYACSVWMFFYFSWIVSFGTIAHAFRQLTLRCWYIHSKQFPPKVKVDNLYRLRKVHQSICDLLRQLNEVYSHQLLFGFTWFFLNITFIGFTIIQQIESKTANNMIFLFCSMAITKVIVVFLINNCVSQVLIYIAEKQFLYLYVKCFRQIV